jgi:hypothetical protein
MTPGRALNMFSLKGEGVVSNDLLRTTRLPPYHRRIGQTLLRPPAEPEVYLFELSEMSALGCGFNWWMQHTRNCISSRSVASTS